MERAPKDRSRLYLDFGPGAAPTPLLPLPPLPAEPYRLAPDLAERLRARVRWILFGEGEEPPSLLCPPEPSRRDPSPGGS